MEEIARQFREELQELLDRYKTKLSVPRIMSIAQDVFHKTLSIKYHPELHNLTKEHLQQIINSGPSFLERHALEVRCSAQMVAEADCDGDIKKCKGACYKEEYKGVFKCTD